MKIDEYFEITRLPEFNRDMKKLVKKYKTLEDDIKIFIGTQIFLYHKLNKDNQGVFTISGLGIEGHNIFKAKKIACMSLGGTGCNSGIRVIYSYEKNPDGKDKIVLIEIYYKGEKENEDRARIFEYFDETNRVGG